MKQDSDNDKPNIKMNSTFLVNSPDSNTNDVGKPETVGVVSTEEFEDTKWVIRIRISKKNRQHNVQKKKYEKTNNDLQSLNVQNTCSKSTIFLPDSISAILNL